MTRSTVALMVMLASLVDLNSGRADPPSQGEVKDAEKLLKDAGIVADGEGLLQFFRKRTPSMKDRERIAALLADLGHPSYQVREKATLDLTAAGESARELLQAALKKAPDEEVRVRAEQCLRSIDQVPHAAQAVAAVRLLGVRRPPGAAEVLLAYLPFADWQTGGDDFLAGLSAVGLEVRGKQALAHSAVVAALTDKSPVCRAAAAHVLGQAGPEQHGPLAGLLADPSPLVRCSAALALVRMRDARAVPVLVDLLAEEPGPWAWQAEEVLSRIAGEQAPPVPPRIDTPAGRRQWRASWQTWWKANESKADLARARAEPGGSGLTIVAEVDGIGQFPGRVSAFDRSGNLRFSVEGVDSPMDVQLLPSLRLLVAEHWAQRITERDRSGKILGEWKLTDKPVSAERQRNGNLFLATYSEILELTPDRKEVFHYKHPAQSMIYCARKLPGGHVLFIDQDGKVTELDGFAKPALQFTPERHSQGAAHWASVEWLRSGRYLISLSGSNKVVETNALGKILWECSVPSPTFATRLPNGHTLVTNVNGREVVEVDASGKEVWKKTTKGRPFRVRRQ